MALLSNSLLLPPKLLTGTQTQTQLPATFQFNHSLPYNHSSTLASSVSLWLHNVNRKFKTSSSTADKQEVEMNKNEEEEYQVLTAIRSSYNDIVIVDTAQSRMLLLDSTHNVHSILYKHQKWTNSYWDEFASLPAIVPEGPIAILGLGGGTAAHLMLDLWPFLQLEGWEIDEILIHKAREYFGLSDLEKPTQAGGVLNIHIGDAFSPEVRMCGGYAGIVIDLFSDGKVLPQLEEVTTWLDLETLLMPEGRLMVNCGGIDCASDVNNGTVNPNNTSTDGSWVNNPAIKALSEAFPGQVSWKKMPANFGANYLALTGPLPEFTSWSAAVPGPLTASVKQWRPC
ncbi:PREDICTED: probable spermidine synthase-like [Fragaria vesca subsp. vesca]